MYSLNDNTGTPYLVRNLSCLKGDLLRYPMWIKFFETFIEEKTKDPSERLCYFSKFTMDGAKEAVSGLLPLDSEEVYIEIPAI